MKTILLLLALPSLLLACSQAETNSAAGTSGTQAVPPATRPLNYIVLLDLSDRLLTPGQVSTDTALVRHLFARFSKKVLEKDLVIRSKDRFQVVIAPQQGVTYDPAQFMDALSVDLKAARNAAEKSAVFDRIDSQFAAELRRLYAAATRNRTSPADFAGCDLWRYFNEQLPHVLVPEADNRLVVLTDGYLDFNDPTFTRCEGNRCTSTSKFLSRLRSQPNWSTLIVGGTWGLLPPKKKFTDLSVAVVELRPKSEFQDETALLKELWQKWLSDLGTANRLTVPHASLSMSKTELDSFFE